LCQRYYEISPTTYLTTYGTRSIANVQFKVEKRVTPTSTVTNNSVAGILAGTSNSTGNYLYLPASVTACSAILVADAEL